MQTVPNSPTSIIELPDWVPTSYRPTAARIQNNVRRRFGTEGGSESAIGLLSPDTHDDGTETDSAPGTSHRFQSAEPSSRDGRPSKIEIRPVKHVIIPPDEDRIANRQLTGWQLFMITLNGTLGAGLYWDGGKVLEIGGPIAAVLSFLFLGVLAWMVMQCITEMLCMWPVPGALSVYVSTFVDEDLGIAVGITYWFSYSFSFAALIAAIASEMATWKNASSIVFSDLVIFILLPILLTAMNWFPIKIYGSIETGIGIAKSVIYITVLMLMFSIAVGARSHTTGEHYSLSNGMDVFRFDEQVSRNWTEAFIICLSQASYSYVGVEIIAASALEAGWNRSRQRNDTEFQRDRNQPRPTMVSNTIRRAAKWFPVVLTFAYTVAVLLVSFNVPSNHCDLPRLNKIENFECVNDNIESENRTSTRATSAFTIAARMSGISHLGDLVNAFLVFTAMFCASNNLYVASRTLFALTNNIQGGPQQPWLLRWLARLGKTNHQKVPLRAVLFSAICFIWILPLGSIIPSAGSFVEVFNGMATIGVLIVWFCNLWAYLNLFNAAKRFQLRSHDKLEHYVEADRSHPDYQYRAHQQPQFAWIALISCLFILIVANGALVWIEFHWVPFLSAYLPIAGFVCLWLYLKSKRNGQWFVDLSKPEHLEKKIRRLNDTRYLALERGVRNPKSRRNWRQWFGFHDDKMTK